MSADTDKAAVVPAVPSDAVDERAAFEAWAKQYGQIFLDRLPNGNYMHVYTQEAWVGWQARAALSQTTQPQAEAVGTHTFVQTVPDHCDRIVWRGRYHHLPLKPPAATPAAPGEVTELLQLLCEPRQWGGTYAAMRHDECINRCCDCGQSIEDEDHALNCPIRKDWETAARIKVLATELRAALAQPAPVAAPARNCEWTNCVHRIGDVCCNDRKEQP